MTKRTFGAEFTTLSMSSWPWTSSARRRKRFAGLDYPPIPFRYLSGPLIGIVALHRDCLAFLFLLSLVVLKCRQNKKIGVVLNPSVDWSINLSIYLSVADPGSSFVVIAITMFFNLQEANGLELEKTRRMERIRAKTQQLQDLILQVLKLPFTQWR